VNATGPFLPDPLGIAFRMLRAFYRRVTGWPGLPVNPLVRGAIQLISSHPLLPNVGKADPAKGFSKVGTPLS
jgi:hypothetical protein